MLKLTIDVDLARIIQTFGGVSENSLLLSSSYQLHAKNGSWRGVGTFFGLNHRMTIIVSYCPGKIIEPRIKALAQCF
jgi:hypothetical protein